MKRLVFALLLLTCSTSPTWAGGLTLSIQDGLVTLDAQDVTVRQILTEWARIGKTQIINVERIPGGPLTLKLERVPEKQALDIILRSIPGYMAVPRTAIVADASIYDRILIMATTSAVAVTRPQQPAPGFPGMSGLQGGANVTQLRPMPPLSPGMLPDSPNPEGQSEDPAIAAAAAAGLVTVPGPNPGAAVFATPLMPPGGAASSQPAQSTPGVGAPTNPWNVQTGTSQPSLAPPAPTPQSPPPPRVRPPQADR